MWFCESAALERCPEFKEHVWNIFQKDRSSRIREASYKKVMIYMEDHATRNEKTYHNNLIDQVIKSERQVPTRKRDADETIKFLSKSFEDDRVERISDVKFLHGFLPAIFDSKTEKRLGMTDAKPDHVFGFLEDRFPPPGSTPNSEIKAIIGVAPGIIHPWFVIENKGCEGTIGVCQNQAIRDGATMVNARRRLNAKATTPSTALGADLNSIAFSCAWVTNLAELYVHWYEQRDLEGPGIFHMHRLGLYVMEREDELRSFRRDIHNILDWGVFKHLPTAEAAVKKAMANSKASS